jgi:hypothetical protein
MPERSVLIIMILATLGEEKITQHLIIQDLSTWFLIPLTYIYKDSAKLYTQLEVPNTYNYHKFGH